MMIRTDVPLASYTTLGVGGPARWLVEVQSDEELLAAVRFARSHKAPFFLLGGGSNLLVSDAGYPGVVIHYAGTGRIEIHRRKTDTTISADAGVVWDSVVRLAVEKDCAGVECLAGIPGSVGGTPVQNVGAYGQEVADTIQNVHAIDLKTEKPVELTSAKCGFAYRRSIFNTTQRGRFAITRVDYNLKSDGPPRIEYRDLKQHFAGKRKPALAEVASAVRKIRASKGMLLSPEDSDSRSAGSFFKNPIVATETVRKIAEVKGCRVEEVPQFPAHSVDSDFTGESGAQGSKPIKLSAAWLIELAGFQKGYTLGRVALSTKHVLAIVNRGGATAAEIVALRDAVLDGVQAKTGVLLEQEPVSVGFGPQD